MKDIDIEAVAKLALQITDGFRKISYHVAGHNDVLNHLASSSIHMALFMQDFYNFVKGNTLEMNDKDINKFLEKCGCNFNKNNAS